jgi:hypothetical protein
VPLAHAKDLAINFNDKESNFVKDFQMTVSVIHGISENR